MLNFIKEKFLNRKFLTFGLIGAFNTILALVLYMAFVKFNMEVGLASIVGDCIPMFISYFLNMKFTYNTKPSWKSFISFPISYLPGIILNMIITILVVDILHAPKMFAKAVALPITIPLNFMVMSLIVKLTTKKEEK